MNRSWKHYLALMISVCLWGSSFIADKIALQTFSPLFLCLIRFMISTAVLLVFRLGRKDFRYPDPEDMKKIIAAAFLGISVYYAIENTAVNMTSAADASVISAAYPLLTILTGIVFYHFRPARNQIVGILMACIGVLILTVSSSRENSSLIGNLMLVFNGFLWALYNYLTGRISRNCDNFSVTYLQILIGTVCFIPMLFLETFTIGTITLSSVLAVLYLAVCCSLAALLLYNYGLRNTDPATTAALMNLMPVAGVVLSALILKETITIRHILGGVIILVGVFVSEHKSQKKQ
ncbi:MAG: DMT family transporter [Solobacterium sp.]|nr:DMT family transporter [Solobacterium sp.]